MAIADDIVSEQIRENGSVAGALKTVKETISRMDRTNAHLWHWERAKEKLEALIVSGKKSIKTLRKKYRKKG